jgi:hypothetical protein
MPPRHSSSGQYTDSPGSSSYTPLPQHTLVGSRCNMRGAANKTAQATHFAIYRVAVPSGWL